MTLEDIAKKLGVLRRSQSDTGSLDMAGTKIDSDIALKDFHGEKARKLVNRKHQKE